MTSSLPRVITPILNEGGAVVSDASRERIREALSDALSAGSKRAYSRHWSAFEQFCAVHNYRPLPADVDVVCEYLQTLEHSTPAARTRGTGTYSVSYVEQTLAAIKYVHRSTIATPDKLGVPALWEHPQLGTFMRAMRNRAANAGTSDPEQAAPLMLVDLAAMIDTAQRGADTWRKHLHERRDTALLLMTWSGGMRRSEPVSLRVRDIKNTYGKWTMTLRRSKTDQTGKTQTKALITGETVMTCPTCAYLRWMEAVTVYDESGRHGLIRLLARDRPLTGHICGPHTPAPKQAMPVFRSITRTGEIAAAPMSPQLVHTIVRRRLAAARPDLDVEEYGAHSLRAGFVTEAFTVGRSEHEIMRQTGHRSSESLRGYARERHAHDNNAATSIGL